MMTKKLTWILSTLIVFSCSKKEIQGYRGQGPTQRVSTETKPVQKQWKGIYALEDSSLYFSNDFEGGRLNGVVADGNDHYTVLITAENEPINPSPWYAFKVWSKEQKSITVQLVCQNSRSRYYPKISRNGTIFQPLDSSKYTPIGVGEGQYGIQAAPESVEIQLDIDNEATWVSAQELWTSSRVENWINALDQIGGVKQSIIGSSREGRPIRMMTIGNEEAERALMIISRQHPPEVTGFLAMKSFVETLAGKSSQAIHFRESFVTYVVPMMNPDGVDNGHWRHNYGGIDLNRDWQDFNQPETSSVRDFLNASSSEGKEFVFGIDFHSTWDDIYYPIDMSVSDESNQIIYDWIEGITTRLPQKQTNVRPSKSISPTMVSRNYFYKNHNMPAIVFELGDNTPRDFLREKGKVAAEEMMKQILERL
jgi:predicted deacylase